MTGRVLCTIVLVFYLRSLDLPYFRWHLSLLPHAASKICFVILHILDKKELLWEGADILRRFCSTFWWSVLVMNQEAKGPSEPQFRVHPGFFFAGNELFIMPTQKYLNGAEIDQWGAAVWILIFSFVCLLSIWPRRTLQKRLLLSLWCIPCLLLTHNLISLPKAHCFDAVGHFSLLGFGKVFFFPSKLVVPRTPWKGTLRINICF